jgi:hypothetical protein
MPKRNPRHGLGSVSQDELDKVQDELRTTDWRNFGMSYLEDFEKGRDIRSKAFGYFNALGYEYGYALAKAYIDGFLSAPDPDSAEIEAARASELLGSHIDDVMQRAPLIDAEYARQAIEEVGDRLPAVENPEELIDFASRHDRGIYMKDFSYSVAEALNWARKALRNFMVWYSVPYPVVYDEKKGYIPEIFQEPSREELKRAIKLANHEIRKRTYYGYHKVRLPDHPNLSILAWSNGGENWHIMWGTINDVARSVVLKGQREITLDANEILVPIHPTVMERVVEELDPLPLFDFSIEAKVSGRYPQADDKTVRKVLRAMVDTEMPESDPEERAIVAMDLWDAFVKAKAGNLAAQRVVEQFFLGLEHPTLAYTNILEDWMKE